jgi:two-component system LytT family response regulator
MKSAKLIPINEYLSLKLEVDRLNQLVADLTDSLAKVNANPNYHLEKGFLVSTKKENKFVKVGDIVMIKAESNYSTLYLQNGEQILTSKTLKHWIVKCNAPFLLRTHKSYVVNKNFIKAFNSATNEVILYDNLLASCSDTGRRLITSLK